MSPSWSRLSKTEAKPVQVPESSSAPLISSGTDLCCMSPLRGNGIGGSTNDTGRNLLAVSFKSFADLLARSRWDPGRWLATLHL
jgi:hypothetical protein